MAEVILPSNKKGKEKEKGHIIICTHILIAIHSYPRNVNKANNKLFVNFPSEYCSYAATNQLIQ